MVDVVVQKRRAGNFRRRKESLVVPPIHNTTRCFRLVLVLDPFCSIRSVFHPAIHRPQLCLRPPRAALLCYPPYSLLPSPLLCSRSPSPVLSALSARLLSLPQISSHSLALHPPLTRIVVAATSTTTTFLPLPLPLPMPSSRGPPRRSSRRRGSGKRLRRSAQPLRPQGRFSRCT